MVHEAGCSAPSVNCYASEQTVGQLGSTEKKNNIGKSIKFSVFCANTPQACQENYDREEWAQ
jgi:hypothetical protein